MSNYITTQPPQRVSLKSLRYLEKKPVYSRFFCVISASTHISYIVFLLQLLVELKYNNIIAVFNVYYYYTYQTSSIHRFVDRSILSMQSITFGYESLKIKYTYYYAYYWNAPTEMLAAMFTADTDPRVRQDLGVEILLPTEVSMAVFYK